MARLSVKEAKLDELSDQLSTTEGLLGEAKKEIKFHRSNLTDEAKVWRIIVYLVGIWVIMSIDN